MDTNIVRDITDIYFEHIVESSHLETDMKKRRKDNEKAVEDMKKTKAHRDMAATVAKKFDEGVVADRARSAVDNQRLDDEQSDTQKSVDNLRKGNRKVTRASASIAASKSERTARDMHPKAGKPGAYRIEALDPVGKEDDDIDNDGKKNTKSDKYLLNRRKAVGKAIATQEAKEIKKWFDDDGDGIGYEPGEVSGKFKKKKKIKEGFSNWRNDLYEVIGKIEKSEKVVEKKVENKITINPSIDLGDGMRESIENLGGTLLEFSEIENFDGVFDYLSESEIFFLTDELIEKVVEEVFEEYIEEGYDILEIENTLLESLEVSSSILVEAKVTHGHDTDVKKDRLEKVKSAVKNVGRKLVSSAGYAAGLAVRGVKAVGRELRGGYKRGRHGSSGSQDSGKSSGETTSAQRSSSDSNDSGETKKPGLLSRIASKLGRGLRKIVHKGAKTVERGAGSVARRTADRPKVTQGRGDDHSKDQREKDLLNRAMYDRVRSHEDHGTPSSVHGKRGVRKPSLRSGIGGGKRVEVAGSGKTEKKEPEIKKVSVKDVTPKKSKAPVGTSENPRVGQPTSDKPKPKPKPEPTVRTRTRTVSTKGFGSFKPSLSGEEAYQKEKEKQETAKSAKKSRTRSSSKKKSKEPNPKKPGAPSLDDLLKSEEFELDEKTLTAAESKEKERILKSLKSKAADFEKRYPGRGEDVMFGVATNIAKKIAEQAMEIQPKTQQQSGQQNVMQKKVAQQKDRQKQQEVQILQRKLQALKSAPSGVDTDITA